MAVVSFIVALALISLCSVVEVLAQQWRPVVLLHGLDASASAMTHTQAWIEEDFPGIYVANIEIGNGIEDSWIWDMNKQVEAFAEAIRADPNLQDGFNMIGHSQGGMTTRAYVERFNDPPVYNLISWSGPQMGVYGVPDIAYANFTNLPSDLADIMDELMEGPASKELQSHCAFCCYWKDVLNYTGYLAQNIYLADINNERETKNETYKKHLTSLNFYALEVSRFDMIVVPRQSPWFEMYPIGGPVTNICGNLNDEPCVVPLQEQPIYMEDWIGLRTLDETDRLGLYPTTCPHQDYPRDQCKKWYDLYTKPLLNNTLTSVPVGKAIS